jgi:hypothetical protein
MSKTPRKAAPKRPAPSPEPTFATLGADSALGAMNAAMQAALGFAASSPATLPAVPDHPAIRQPPAPPPVPFCRQVTIIRAQGGFTLFATEPGDGSFECDPADAIAVASTPTDLLARVQEWAGKSEPRNEIPA